MISRPFLVSAVLCCATVVAFSPALTAPYEFDDIASISGNATIRSLSPAIALSPPANTAVAGRPIVNYSLALNYAVNEWLGVDQRPDPLGPYKTVGFHVVNVLVHILCGLLLFGIVRRTVADGRERHGWTIGADWLATGVAALWMLHPIQTETVDYVVQRTEGLVSVCYLATLYFVVRGWSANRRALWWNIAAVAVCLIGMGCKEVMVTAPLVVLLYDRAFRVGQWRALVAGSRRWLYLALFATVGWSVVLIASDSRNGTVGFGLGITWYQYLYSQAWAIGHYLRLVAWPDQLTFDYGQRAITGWRGVPGLIMLSVLGVLTILAWTRVARWGWAAFLGAWFFLTLAPSSSVVPIATEIAAERRIYLALAAVLVMIVVAVDWARRRVAVPRMRMKGGVSFVFGATCAALLVATMLRSATYRSPERLWRDTVRKAPTNPRAYDNLAFTLFFDDPPRLAEAKELYWIAIGLDTTYLHPWPGLASIAVDEGKPNDAIWLLQRALAINPDYADATDHLGRLLLRLHQPSQAVPYLERFAKAYPADTSLVPLANAYMQSGNIDGAATALRGALSYNPDRADAMEYLGGILAEENRPAEAIPLLEGAMQRGRETDVGYGLLSLAYAEGGDANGAEHAAQMAARRTVNSPNALVLAARAMRVIGKTAEAQGYLDQAARMSTSHTTSDTTRAR